MISLETLAPHIHRIRQSIPDSVRLIAVTKNIPVESMRVAYAAGLHELPKVGSKKPRSSKLNCRIFPISRGTSLVTSSATKQSWP
jgi:hypothetical protein